MEKIKRLNPYQQLLKEIKSFIAELKYTQVKSMYLFPKSDLKTSSYSMYDVAERVEAAKTLGYEVIIENAEDGLRFKYRKKIKIPWRWE